jgi:hypothetical protein
VCIANLHLNILTWSCKLATPIYKILFKKWLVKKGFFKSVELPISSSDEKGESRSLDGNQTLTWWIVTFLMICSSVCVKCFFWVPKTDDVGGTSQMDYFRLNQPLSSVETLHKIFVCWRARNFKSYFQK